MKNPGSPQSLKQNARFSINAAEKESNHLSFEKNEKLLEDDKRTESDAGSFIPSEFNKPVAKNDILEDIANAN